MRFCTTTVTLLAYLKPTKNTNGEGKKSEKLLRPLKIWNDAMRNPVCPFFITSYLTTVLTLVALVICLNYLLHLNPSLYLWISTVDLYILLYYTYLPAQAIALRIYLEGRFRVKSEWMSVRMCTACARLYLWFQLFWICNWY